MGNECVEKDNYMNDEDITITVEEELEYAKICGREGVIFPREITREEAATLFYRTYKEYMRVKKTINSGNVSQHDFYDIIVNTLFSMDDNKYYYKLKQRVQTYFDDFTPIEENVMQIFDAFEKELYYPCLCGSIPMIERLIQDSERPKTTSLITLLNRKTHLMKEKAKDNIDGRILAENLSGFLECLAKPSSFSEVEPDAVNRHWFLHGRTNRLATKTDCLKVFSLIDSIIEMIEIAD